MTESLPARSFGSKSRAQYLEKKSGSDSSEVALSPLLKSLAVLVVVFVVAGFGLAAAMVSEGGETRGEAEKLLLQFLLITGVGGILVAGLGALRDRETREDQAKKEQEEKIAARIEVLQSLDTQLGKTYRELKAVKRQLRSQLLAADRDHKGRPGPPYVFPVTEFRKSMADLLAAQIRAEDIRDQIRVRTDLFDSEQLERIHVRLRYATRFFHDVHEDFERAKVKIEGDRCTVDAGCSNIDSLINGRSFPADLPVTVETELKTYLRAKGLTMTQQHSAIDRIEALRETEDPQERRFRAIADDCFALASAEIRRTIARESGMSVADDPQVSHRDYDQPPDEAVPSPLSSGSAGG